MTVSQQPMAPDVPTHAHSLSVVHEAGGHVPPSVVEGGVDESPVATGDPVSAVGAPESMVGDGWTKASPPVPLPVAVLLFADEPTVLVVTTAPSSMPPSRP